MGGMTGGAELFGMFAWTLFQLINLIGMAGEARIGETVGKGDVKRRVRVLVTVQATFEFKMLLAGVTHAALGNYVGVIGRMTLVTVNTGYFGLVLAACTFNGLRCGIMAFNAIVDTQNRTLSILCRGKGSCYPCCQEDCKSGHHVFHRYHLFIFFTVFHLSYPPGVKIKRQTIENTRQIQVLPKAES